MSFSDALRERLPTVCLLVVALFALRLGPEASGQDTSAEKPEAASTQNPFQFPIGELVRKVRPSIAVVSFDDRDGRRAGLGTGFVVGANGVIATNLHVIGEARPIHVRFEDGRKFDVLSVLASDRSMDLALLKIDADDLPVLELGDSDRLEQGQPVVAVGNPLGLEQSVVAGIVSGIREVEGRPMIQLAMPIEKGNSGGPLLDMQGRVQGILTLKSLVKQNLGYAVVGNALKALMEEPNPISMDRWLTVGVVDSREWNILGGATWRQRAGRVNVSGTGKEFGGRALCLSRKPTPELPFEISVDVRLEDESGAAGLVFHADDQQRHYGFYPSSGKLRFSRFDGPTVFNWQVLHEIRSPHYRPGEWNRLTVRINSEKIECLCNGHLIVESKDTTYGQGQVGLAKFRDTVAEFRPLRMGRDLEQTPLTEQQVDQLRSLARELPTEQPPTGPAISQAIDLGEDSPDFLLNEARALEQRALRIKQLAASVRERRIQQALFDQLNQDEQDIDLLNAALLIARLDNHEIDPEAYSQQVDSLASQIRGNLAADSTPRERWLEFNRQLFEEMGFHGSRTRYYHRSNSYLNEAIDDREGLPITLSVLYMELARRLDLRVVGLGLPGHFVVRWHPDEADETGEIVDPFERGRIIDRNEARQMVEQRTGEPFDEAYWEPTQKRAIIIRMLRNLWSVALNEEDRESMLRYINTLVLLDPQNGRDRWFRALLRLQTDRFDQAAEDVDWLLQNPDPAVDRREIQQLRDHIDNLRSSRPR